MGRSIRTTMAPALVALGSILLSAAGFPAVAPASSRTIGPITTTSGTSCYLTNSLVHSVSSFGLADVTYGSGWSCTTAAGSKPFHEGLLSDTLTERYAGMGIDSDLLQKYCSDYQCSQSAHHQGLPGSTYTLTSELMLRLYHTLNGDWSDDEYISTWPSNYCSASTTWPYEPAPDTVRCTFSVSLAP